MSRALLIPAVALSGALLLGCGDQSSPTAANDPARPEFGAERFLHLDAFLLGGDPSNPLVLQAGYAAGVTMADICADPFGQLFEGVGQIVFTPSGAALTHSLGRDISVVVYQYGGGIVTDPCPVVGAPILGSGTGDFSYTPLFTSAGTVAIHVTAHGIIDLVSGGQARLFAMARITVRPDGTLLFDQESVRLTPL
jgi:hypothetical protein